VTVALPKPDRDMIVDVVDDADRKIGQAPRKEVLPRALNFHTVHLFLFDVAGRLLLQQLGAKRERHALKWGASVAAYLFAGETYDEAIRRRALQELGVTIEPRPIGKIQMTDENSTKFVTLFTARLQGDLSPDAAHIEDIRFASVDDVAAELEAGPEEFTPTFRKVFELYLRSL
jgi:isopentenyl-diphosphate Delta-isomerase